MGTEDFAFFAHRWENPRHLHGHGRNEGNFAKKMKRLSASVRLGFLQVFSPAKKREKCLVLEKVCQRAFPAPEARQRKHRHAHRRRENHKNGRNGNVASLTRNRNNTARKGNAGLKMICRGTEHEEKRQLWQFRCVSLQKGNGATTERTKKRYHRRCS